MLSKKRIASMKEHAEYTLRNGGYNINPIPDAHSVIQLIEEREILLTKIGSFKEVK